MLRILEKPHISMAIKISLIYFIFGFIWIILSDRILDLLINDAHLLTSMQTYKGWFFILITALLVFFLVKNFNSDIAKAKELIEKENEISSTYLQVSSVLIVVLSTDYKINIINARGAALLGFNKGMIIGRNWFDYFHVQDEKISIKKSLDNLLKNKSRQTSIFESTLATGQGNTRIIRWRVQIVNYKDDAEEIICAGEDISDLIQIQRRLEQSEERYRMLFESAADAIYIVDAVTSEFLETNPVICARLGYTRDEFLKLKLWDIIVPEKQNDITHNTRAIIGNKTAIFESAHITKKGKKFPVEVSSKLIMYKGRQAILSIARDISERKLFEDNLKKIHSSLRLLSDCNQVIVRSNDENQLIEKICSNITEIGRYDFAWIGLINNNDNGTLTPVSWSSKNPHFNINNFPSLFVDDKNQNPAYYVLKENKNYTETIHSVSDIDKYTWQDTALNLLLNSVSSFPLTIEQKVIGSLNVYSSQTNFDNDEIRLLVELAEDISYGINVIRKEEEKHKTEKALRTSEEKFSKAFHTSPDAIVMSRMEDGMYIDVNSGFTELTGYNPDEVVGKTTFELNIWLNKDDRNEMIRIIKEKGEIISFESKFRMKDGSIRIGSMSAKVIEVDGEPCLLTITRDISQQYAVNEQLRKLSRAIEFSPASIFITDFEGNIEYVNPKYTEQTLYTLDEAIGTKPLIFQHWEVNDEKRIKMQEILLSGSEWMDEFLNKKKNGDTFWESVHISPIRNSEGAISHFIAISEDITEKHKYQELLIEAKEKAEQSDMLKSEFLAQMSHEIRTPVNVILNFTSLIKEELGNKAGKTFTEEVKIMGSAGLRIVRTIDLILNMSEIQTGTYKPVYKYFDIYEAILDNIYSEFYYMASEKQLKLNLIKNTDEGTVYADEYSVYQIFQNLLYNALKYTQEGKIDIIVDQSSKWLNVSIADTGIGISEEYIPNLFKPFTQEEQGYSRKYEGNGLGLALVKKYCTINNAEISVKSKKNEGSVFTVAFSLENTHKHEFKS